MLRHKLSVSCNDVLLLKLCGNSPSFLHQKVLQVSVNLDVPFQSFLHDGLTQMMF